MSNLFALKFRIRSTPNKYMLGNCFKLLVWLCSSMCDWITVCVIVFQCICDCVGEPQVTLRVKEWRFSQTNKLNTRYKTYIRLSKNIWHLNCPFFQRVLVNKVKNREIFGQLAFAEPLFGAPFVDRFSWMLLHNTLNILTTSHFSILNRLSLWMLGDLPDLLAWVPHPHLSPIPPDGPRAPYIPFPYIPYNPYNTASSCLTNLPSPNCRNNLLSISRGRSKISSRRQVGGAVQNSPKPRNPNLRILSAYQR